MAGQFISHRVRARKRVAKRRPSLVRRLGAMTAVLWAIIGWVEFGPKRPVLTPTAPAPQHAIIIAPAVRADTPRAEPLPIATATPARRTAARRARPSGGIL